MHLGHWFLPLIFDILLQFRFGQIALATYIKQLSLNINIGFIHFIIFFEIFVIRSISEKQRMIVYRCLRVIFGFKKHYGRWSNGSLIEVFADDVASSLRTVEEGF